MKILKKELVCTGSSITQNKYFAFSPFSDGGASFLKGLSENGLDGKGFIYTMIKL